MIDIHSKAAFARAFLELHDCVATHVDSVPVIEGYEGEIIWSGDVEVFDLKFHPTASRGYAWKFDDEGDIVTVLEVAPVDSPYIAVQTAILRRMREAAKQPVLA